jgi:hypothetical protein
MSWNKKILPFSLLIILDIVVIIGLFLNLHHKFYHIEHCILFVGFLLMMYFTLRTKQIFVFWVFIVFMIYYNPFWSIYLFHHWVWIIVDIILLIFLIFCNHIYYPSKNQNASE